MPWLDRSTTIPPPLAQVKCMSGASTRTIVRSTRSVGVPGSATISGARNLASHRCYVSGLRRARTDRVVPVNTPRWASAPDPASRPEWRTLGWSRAITLARCVPSSVWRECRIGQVARTDYPRVNRLAPVTTVTTATQGEPMDPWPL